MEKFTTLTGVAAPLPIDNVDTDMIIPKQYLKTIKRTGLGAGLFSEMRYKDDGSPNPDFVLNKPAYAKAKILVAGDNFGCGSSREHAPWALLDFGIRCVISTDFADIFYNNCFKNGILPIKVKPEDLPKLMDDAERGANATLTIDLPNQEIRGPDGGVVKFEIDPFRKHSLLEGPRRHRLDADRSAGDLELRDEGQRGASLALSSGASTRAPDFAEASRHDSRLPRPLGLLPRRCAGASATSSPASLASRRKPPKRAFRARPFGRFRWAHAGHEGPRIRELSSQNSRRRSGTTWPRSSMTSESPMARRRWRSTLRRCNSRKASTGSTAT